MIRSNTVVESSHAVKVAVATCLVAVGVVLLGQLLVAHLSQTSRELVSAAACQDGACVPTAAVRRAVIVLEDEGLDCRVKPGLTDHVVFEWKTTEVTVVDFATALRASSNHEGWARRYCMPA